MSESINIGDVVVSTSGRDQGKYFLVVAVSDKSVTIVNGKERKVTAAKEKNVKHIRSVASGVLIDLAWQIYNGESVGNERLRRAINSKLIKKQED